MGNAKPGLTKILCAAAVLLVLTAAAFIFKSASEEEVVTHKSEAPSGEHLYTNRLIHEKSPYLLQHAHNPVDWYPWGKEAFDKAVAEDKPIFLSIGYSTCHWCHVMEKESFENADIARLLNEYFVPIKVDREERPDIDKIYMSFVVASTGSGGWPMSVFLTPERKPFYGGTYFPPKDMYGRPGFDTLLRKIHATWTDQKEKVKASSEQFIQLFEESVTRGREGDVSETLLLSGYRHYLSMYDASEGGFGGAPKFPSAHGLSFLMRYYARTGESEALKMAEKTLIKMAEGGIRDHVGGGFHRYSVDAEWFLPHFEKMLYDQAMMMRAYTEAYQITGNPLYRTVAEETGRYVIRDLMDKDGGFYSAEDADSPVSMDSSEKKEGAFYVWKYETLSEVLGKDFKIFAYLYGVDVTGNILNDPHGEFDQQNHLAVKKSAQSAAAEFNISVDEVEAVRSRSLSALSEIRNKRLRPHLDDKILTDWNGLMIDALAYSGFVFENQQFISSASAAAERILKEFRNSEGHLYHRFRDGEAAIEGQLDDYAFFLKGLLTLYQSTQQPKWLRSADGLAGQMVSKFQDATDGTFYMTLGSEDDYLISRPKDFQDGALPAGSSVAAYTLLEAGALMQNSQLEQAGRRLVEATAGHAESSGTSFSYLLQAVDFALGPVKEVVLSADRLSDVKPFLDVMRSEFLPRTVVVVRTQGDDEFVQEFLPYAVLQSPIDHLPTAYICKDHVCQLPTTDIDKFSNNLKQK